MKEAVRFVAEYRPVPGSTFYHDAGTAKNYTRFAFCKKLETLERAAERLSTMAARD